MQSEVVHGLWIGTRLGPMQLLTIRSFQSHGFKFHLWTYDRTVFPLPPGVVLRDANEIIPEQKVFRYPQDGNIDVAFGKGSCAGFSDIFRYKLLYDHGGWYTDMDVTCLKAPDFGTEYVFRDHWLLLAVGNIMRCPPRSDVMRLSYELALRAVGEDNDDWHKPVRIMCRYIKQLGLSQYVRKGICNLDDSAELNTRFICGNEPFPDSWCFVHWCNAMNGDTSARGGRYHALLREHGCDGE